MEPERRSVRALQLCTVVLEHCVGPTAPAAGTVEPELRAVRALQLCAVIPEHCAGPTAPAAGSRSRARASSGRLRALLCLDVSSAGRGASVGA